MDSPTAPVETVDPSGNISQTPDLKVYDTFESMGLPEKLLRGIFAYGFERPSDIQTKAIVPIREGRDVLARPARAPARRPRSVLVPCAVLTRQ